MKYLHLFEAFEGEAISKVIKFLDKKLGRDSSYAFKTTLKNIMKRYDIPIDKIKNNNLQYLNRIQALKIRNKEDVDNQWGIYCLKFWFSLEEGYLGHSGVGNQTFSFKDFKGGRRSTSGELTIDDIQHLIDSGLKTGELIPIRNYSDLETGDELVGFLSDYSDNLDALGKFKIWRDGEQLYAIQDFAYGGVPNSTTQELPNGEEIIRYSWGRGSWSLGDVGYPADDHHKLHYYKESDKPLHVKGKEMVTTESESPFDFNLPTRSNGSLTSWGNSNSISYENIEKSDFAIVFYLGDMLDPDKADFYETPSSIKQEREKEKEGALKLKDDESIRRENIQRYTNIIISKMGINIESTGLNNLEKLIKLSICDNFAIISLYKDEPGLGSLNNIISNIYSLLEADVENKSYYIDRIISRYKNLTDSSNSVKKQFNISYNHIKKEGGQVSEVFDIFIETGNDIKKHLDSINIENIDDLVVVYHKLKAIYNIFRDDNLRVSNKIRNIMSDFYYPSDVQAYCSRYKDEDFSDDIKKANFLRKNISSLLK